MTELLLQTGLSNALFSLLLAIIALVIGLVFRRPQLTYVLWLLVLIKLLTPPVVSVPLAPALWQAAPGGTAQLPLEEPALGSSGLAGAEQPAGTAHPPGYGAAAFRISGRAVNWLAAARTWLPPLLLIGSLLALAWSAVRVVGFHRRLAAEAEPAPAEIQGVAADVARRLNLRRAPGVYTTSAHMSPLVWWLDGRLAIVMPAQLLGQLDCQQQQLVLAHELAHVRRRDYLVRWLEWLACLSFWWNPVVWWAQRNLRATEEICCDALVLSCLKPQPRSYAKSLLAVVEFLTYPALRPPVLASQISNGGLFLRRCRMIVSANANRTTARWMHALVIILAIVVLPLGAQLYAKGEADAKPAKTSTEKGEKAAAGTDKQSQEDYLGSVWADLEDKVEAGELTQSEAEARLEEVKMALELNSCTAAAFKAELKAAVHELEAEVAAGTITKQEADGRLAEIEHSVKERQLGQQETYTALAEAWGRQETLINEGMATFEEAVREYEHAKQQILTEGDVYAGASQYYQDAVAEFQGAIRDGKLTHAEAFTRLSTVEMAVFAKAFMQAEKEYLEQAAQHTDAEHKHAEHKDAEHKHAEQKKQEKKSEK